MTETSIRLEDALAQAGSLDQVKITYANRVQITITQNEVFLDFYIISPIAEKSIAQVIHIHRIAMAHGQMKGLAEAIANVVDSFEQKNKVTLPNLRERQEGERIKIWE